MKATSKKAFASVQDEADRQRIKMMQFVEDHADHTSNELGKLSDEYDRYQFARRLPELRDQGTLINPHTRFCEVSGREAMTWAVAV